MAPCGLLAKTLGHDTTEITTLTCSFESDAKLAAKLFYMLNVVKVEDIKARIGGRHVLIEYENRDGIVVARLTVDRGPVAVAVSSTWRGASQVLDALGRLVAGYKPGAVVEPGRVCTLRLTSVYRTIAIVSLVERVPEWLDAVLDAAIYGFSRGAKLREVMACLGV